MCPCKLPPTCAAKCQAGCGCKGCSSSSCKSGCAKNGCSAKSGCATTATCGCGCAAAKPGCKSGCATKACGCGLSSGCAAKGCGCAAANATKATCGCGCGCKAKCGGRILNGCCSGACSGGACGCGKCGCKCGCKCGGCGGGGACDTTGGCGACGKSSLGTYEAAFHKYTLSIPAAPTHTGPVQALPASGLIGMTVNGVLLYRDHDGPNATRTFDADEMDNCMGHTSSKDHGYHYHLLPVCLFAQLGLPGPKNSTFWFGPARSYTSAFPATAAAPSPVLGWAMDGHAIYGPYDSSKAQVRSADLDQCNGKMDNGEYKYFFTAEPPFVPACFRGMPGSIADAVPNGNQACPAGGRCNRPNPPLFMFPNTGMDSPLWKAFAGFLGVSFAVIAVAVTAVSALECRIHSRRSREGRRFPWAQVLTFAQIWLGSVSCVLFYLIDPYVLTNCQTVQGAAVERAAVERVYRL